MDARGGESNPQHVLLSGDVVRGGDAVQVTHVAEKEEKRRFQNMSGSHIASAASTV